MILALLAGCGAPAPPPVVDPALQAEREPLRAAERALLERTARDALAQGRPGEAALAVSSLASLDADAAERLAAEVLATDDPHALLLLAETAPPALAAAARDRTATVVLERRWGPDRASTVAARAGLSREHGRVVLAGVRAEYVSEPDGAAMLDAARRRVDALWASPAVRAAAPLGPRPSPAPTLEETVDAAVSAGLPEPDAVAEVVEAALEALDPYTRPVWPAALTGWQEHHAGAYTGVGLDLLDDPDGGVRVELPALGGPAYVGGVHAGDRVVAVAGVAVETLPTPRSEAAAALLRGEPGSTVEVVLERAGAPLTVALTRAEIRPPTVFGFARGPANAWVPWADEGVVLVRIAAFRSHTDEEFDALVDGLSPAVVVLDLRANPGGDVMSAVNVADRFIADGELAHLRGRTIPLPEAGEGEVAWNVAVPGHALEGVPAVVLIDHDSASAAELVAGALHERVGAVLVGERTFGKGLSQGLRGDDAAGVAWQVSNGAWTLPSGAALEAPGGVHLGLPPDVEVPLSAAERWQADRLRRMRERPTTHADGSPVPWLGPVDRAELPTLSADPQLDAALRVARRLRDGDYSQSGPER